MMEYLCYITGEITMLEEKDMMVYGTFLLFGIGAILVVDAYVKGIQGYVPMILETRR